MGDYIEVRVPRSEWGEVSARIGRLFAYRRLDGRDGEWGLVWDFVVAGELAAAELEIEALRAALRVAWGHLSPEVRDSVRETHAAAQNA